MKDLFGKKFLLPVCFADGGSGGSGGSEGAGEGNAGEGNTPSGSQQDPDKNNADGGGQQSDSSGGQSKEPFATFPTEAAFMSRVKQASNQELKKLAEEMGFESPDKLKEAAKKAKDIEEQNKSELEKAQSKNQELEQRNQQVMEEANRKLVNAELKVFATQSGFVDPQDAIVLADRSGVQVGEDDQIKGAKEAVEALAKNKPHLLGKASKASVGGAFNPGGDGDGGMSEEELGRRDAERRQKERQTVPDKGYNPWAGSEH